MFISNELITNNQNIITNNNNFFKDSLLSNFKINHLFIKTLLICFLLLLSNLKNDNDQDKIEYIIFYLKNDNDQYKIAYSFIIISLICHIYSNTKNRLGEKSVLSYIIIQSITVILFFITVFIKNIREHEVVNSTLNVFVIFFIISCIYKFKLIWLNVSLFYFFMLCFIAFV